MSVSFNECSRGKTASSASTSFEWQHTVSSERDRIVIVAVAVQSAVVSVSRVTVGGDDAVSAWSDPTKQLSVWSLPRPVPGASAVRVFLSGPSQAVGISQDFYGAAQSESFGGVVFRSGTGSVCGSSPVVESGGYAVDFVFAQGSTVPQPYEAQSGRSVVGGAECGSVSGFDSIGGVLRSSQLLVTDGEQLVRMAWDLSTPREYQYISVGLRPVSLRLRWADVEGAIGYQVVLYRGFGCSGEPSYCSGLLTDNFFDVPAGIVCSGSNVSWRVVAFGDTGYCDSVCPCNSQRIIVAPSGMFSELKPSTPVFLTPVISCRSVLVRWAPSSGARGYLLERGTNGVDFTELAALGTGDNEYLDSGLSGQFWYRIKAFNFGGQTAPVTTGPVDVSICGPTGVSVGRLSSHPLAAISVSWINPATGNFTEVWRSSGGVYSKVGEVAQSGSAQSWNDPQITFGVNYTYKLRTRLSGSPDTYSAFTEPTQSISVAAYDYRSGVQLGNEVVIYAPSTGWLVAYYNDGVAADNYGSWDITCVRWNDEGDTHTVLLSGGLVGPSGAHAGVNFCEVVGGALYRFSVAKLNFSSEQVTPLIVWTSSGLASDADGNIYGSVQSGSGDVYWPGTVVGTPSASGPFEPCPDLITKSLVVKFETRR